MSFIAGYLLGLSEGGGGNNSSLSHLDEISDFKILGEIEIADGWTVQLRLPPLSASNWVTPVANIFQMYAPKSKYLHEGSLTRQLQIVWAKDGMPMMVSPAQYRFRQNPDEYKYYFGSASLPYSVQYSYIEAPAKRPDGTLDYDQLYNYIWEQRRVTSTCECVSTGYTNTADELNPTSCTLIFQCVCRRHYVYRQYRESEPQITDEEAEWEIVTSGGYDSNARIAAADFPALVSVYKSKELALARRNGFPRDDWNWYYTDGDIVGPYSYNQ